MFKLTIEFGGKTVKTYEFTKAAISVGRELDNDIVIDNLGVSRHHCKVEEKPGGIHVVTDLGSNNGTFVKGDKVSSYNLNDGDAISIGKYSIIYENPRQQAEATRDHKPGIMDMPTMEIGQEVKAAPQGPMTLEVDAADMERMQRERASAVKAYMTFKIGGRTEQFPMQKSFFFIGSASDADFRTKGWRIMPRHTLLVRDETGYTIVNLSVKKPTYLNGKKADKERLKNADVIKVGKSDFTYFIGKPK